MCVCVQIIQRQLEQVEEKQRQLEERGVAVEKALRGEAGNKLYIQFFIYLYHHKLDVTSTGSELMGVVGFITLVLLIFYN